MRQIFRTGTRSRGLRGFCGALLVVLLAALGAQQGAAQQAAAPKDGAEALVRRIYAHYLDTQPDTEVAFDYTNPEVAKNYFDAGLVKLLAADSRRDTTRLDFDPFVDGQEFEIKSVDYETRQASPRESVVSARFDNFDQPTLVTFKLTRGSSGWRITDVLWAGGRGTLKKLLATPTS